MTGQRAIIPLKKLTSSGLRKTNLFIVECMSLGGKFANALDSLKLPVIE